MFNFPYSLTSARHVDPIHRLSRASCACETGLQGSAQAGCKQGTLLFDPTCLVCSQVKDLEVVLDREAAPVSSDDPYMAMIRPMLSGRYEDFIR